MTTTQNIVFAFITIIAYFAGIDKQRETYELYDQKEYIIDYIYPITVGFFLIRLCVISFFILLLLVFGIKNSLTRQVDHGLDTFQYVAEHAFGSLTALIYYPLLFLVYYLFGEINVWIAAPMALVALGLLCQGYGSLRSKEFSKC